MTINRFGGQKTKKMAAKGIGKLQVVQYPQTDTQYFAKVEKVLGDSRYRLQVFGEDFKGLGKLPGSKRRLSKFIREGSYVLFDVWDFTTKNLNEECKEKRGDVLCVYDEVDLPEMIKASSNKEEDEGISFDDI